MQGLCMDQGSMGQEVLREGEKDGQEVQAVPMFRSVDAALRFAFSIRESVICNSPQYNDTSGCGKSADALSPHDWHAQGAMIISAIIHKLPTLQAAYIIAFYGWGSTKNKAISLVADSLGELHGNRKLLRDLTKRYFSIGKRRKSQRKIADDHQIPRRTLRDIEEEMTRILAVVGAHCERRLTEYFVQQGLVEG